MSKSEIYRRRVMKGERPSQDANCTHLHIPQPVGYAEWDAWADEKSKTHRHVL